MGSSHDPELSWDSNVPFYSTDTCSVALTSYMFKRVNVWLTLAKSAPGGPSLVILFFCFGEEMATWPALLGDIPPPDRSGPVRLPSLFIMEADVLLKRGKTIPVFTEFVSCGSEWAEMLNTCLKLFSGGGDSFSFKLKAQNVTALFFMYVIYLSLAKNYIYRKMGLSTLPFNSFVVIAFLRKLIIIISYYF